MVRILALVVAVILAACGPTPITITAEPERNDVAYMGDVVRLERELATTHPAVMRAAVLGHIAFIEAHTTLRYNGEPLPIIEVWPPWMILVAAGKDALGMYEDNTIVLPAGFTHHHDQTAGVLLHEMVHYLQDVNNVMHIPCRRRAEVLAYQMSNLWVKAQPSSVGDRFYATPELIRRESSC